MMSGFLLGSSFLECAEMNGPWQPLLFGYSAGNPKEMFITNRKPFILPTGSATLKANGAARHRRPLPHRSLPFPFRLLSIPRAHTPQTGNALTHSGGKRNGTRRVGPSGVQSLVCTKSSELTQFGGQAKVNNLDLCPGGVDADNVLRLEVQVDDVLLVHVLHALQDLLHVASAGGLCVLKVVVDQAFEELAACNTGTQTRLCSVLKGTPRSCFFLPPPPQPEKS